VFIAAVLAAVFLFLPLPEAGAGTLRVNWDTVPAPDLAGFRLRYGTDGVSFSSQLDVPDPDAVSREVTGLTVGTTYYFVVQAYDDSFNLSPYSNMASATVAPWDAEADPPGLAPALVSLSSPLFELSWDVSGFAGVSGAGLEVSKVDQSFSNPNGTSWDPTHSCYQQALISPSGTTILSAADFEGPGLYQIRVAAIDSFGTLICHWSDSAVFEVLAGAPPVDPDATMVTASPEEIPADGTSVSLITVTPCDASSALSGPGLLVTLETTAGMLLGSVVDQGDGTYTQQLQSSFDVTTAQVSAIAGGVAITQQAAVAFAGIPAMIITGPGPGENNPPRVRVFDPATGEPVPGLDFLAYGVNRWGVNVGSGDVTGNGKVEILTGPGPGAVFGPQIRVFDDTGDPSALNSFMAYGTMRWGAKVITGDIDGDHVDEILTAPGPGAVFGPHIRAFEFDGSQSFVPLEGVSYFAYGTMKYGANVACGDIDGDGIDEIVTGAGPGDVFGPHVRAFNFDGGTLEPIAAVSFMAYGTLQYGVNVACGDIDGDGIDEIITGPGPGEVFGTHVRAFNYDGDELVPITGVSFSAYDGDLRYGVNVACGDLDGDGIDEIITGPGPGPEEAEAYTARVLGWNYDGVTLEAIPGLDILAYDQSILRGARVATGPIDTGRAAAPPATDKEQQEKTAAESTVAGLVIK
jgi:hypothetical protein